MSTFFYYRVFVNPLDRSQGKVSFPTTVMSIPPMLPAHGDIVKSEEQGKRLFQLVASRKHLNLWVPLSRRLPRGEDPEEVIEGGMDKAIFAFLSTKEQNATLDLEIKLVKKKLEDSNPYGKSSHWTSLKTVLYAMLLTKVAIERYVPMGLQLENGKTSGYVASLRIAQVTTAAPTLD